MAGVAVDVIIHFPYRGCHAVLFGPGDSSICVLQLLEEACLHLAEVSLNSNQSAGSKFYRSLVWGMLLVCELGIG